MADGLAQPSHQHLIAVRPLLRRRFPGVKLGAGEHGVAKLLEAAKGRLFDDGMDSARIMLYLILSAALASET